MSTAELDTAAIAPGISASLDSTRPESVVLTRFGMVPATPTQQVRFKDGLPGFPDVELFQLERVPQLEGDLLLLQSVDHVDIAFFVLPLDPNDNVIHQSDVANSCGQLDIAVDNLMILTVVKLQRNGDQLERFLNLRAPIFVDTQKQTGTQIVLNNPEYPIRFKLES